MFAFGAPPPRRRVNLTPMIDVIFLLVVFFLLAARFGAEGGLPVAGGGAGAGSDVPRLVTVAPGGVALNGVALEEAALPAALGATGPAVVLRPLPGTDVQRLVDVASGLAAAGFARIAVVGD